MARRFSRLFGASASRQRALRLFIAATAGCVVLLQLHQAPMPGADSGRRSALPQAFLPAPGAVGPLASSIGQLSDPALGDLPSLLLASSGGVGPAYTEELGWRDGSITGGSTDASAAFDLYYYVYIGISILVIIVAVYLLSKPYWEYRELNDKIQKAKMPFILDDPTVTALDRYSLARLYIKLRDYPAALGEFEEVEDEWIDSRDSFDPEDAMGALSARAMLHNSKGYSLTLLEPPRTAQARKEFVRAVTFWPEYPEALLNIGRELTKRGRYEVAIRTLDAALKWQPGSELLQGAAQEAREKMEAAMAEEEDEYDSDDEEDELETVAPGNKARAR